MSFTFDLDEDLQECPECGDDTFDAENEYCTECGDVVVVWAEDGPYSFTNEERDWDDLHPELPFVRAYTDGSTLGENRSEQGGWGVLLVGKGGVRRGFSGTHVGRTTNNRMELQAGIEALRALTKTSAVEVVSDSEYMVKGMNEWVKGWVKRKFDGVKNVDLWKTLIELGKQHAVKWTWVKGHNGHPENEEADRLAGLAAEGKPESYRTTKEKS